MIRNNADSLPRKLYSIGEVATIMGISVQMLRNYANLNMVKPEYVDEETGYRYYSFSQFHYIDRIKYLRGLKLSLPKIQEFIETADIDRAIPILENHREIILEEKRKIEEVYENLNWYIDYFRYFKEFKFDNIPYLVNLDKRYILYTDYQTDDTVETVETRLAILKNDSSMADLRYNRQFGYIADFEQILQKKFIPKKYFVYVKDGSAMKHKQCMEIPGGTYLCFRGRIHTDEWNPEIIQQYFTGLSTPEYVIANEYEDSLREYHYCPYEVQILIQEDYGEK